MFKLLLIGPFISALTTFTAPPVENPVATIRSTETEKISPGSNFSAPKIDGNLDEECWQHASVNKDFVISTPNFGKPSAYNTEVKIIYDDNA